MTAGHSKEVKHDSVTRMLRSPSWFQLPLQSDQGPVVALPGGASECRFGHDCGTSGKPLLGSVPQFPYSKTSLET